MGKRICSVDDCKNPVHTKGFCSPHAHRMRRYGDPNGGGLFRFRGRKCEVTSCDRPYEANGYCRMHYGRVYSGGDLTRSCETCGKDCDGRAVYCSEDCRAKCSEDGCDEPSRSRGYCPSHYQDWRHGGRSYKWSTELICVVCGGDVEPGSGLRKYCSAACVQVWHRNGQTAPPLELPCTHCSVTIYIRQLGKAERKRRDDVKLCDLCRNARHTRHRVSVSVLANLKGADCGICGDPVDMKLRSPDYDSPSVDHILPRSLGGSDDLDNLQVAHLHCNRLKRATPNFTIDRRTEDLKWLV